MRITFFIAFLFLMTMPVLAQETDLGDTTIYQITQEKPRFPACEKLDTTIQVIERCAQEALLSFMYQNIQYPFEARENGDQGTVVISFIVEKDSSLSNFKLLRDVGGGCGAEALRIASAMQEIGVKWVPGKNNGQVVRSQFTLPIKFKLEEPLPYYLVGLDTVYTQFETPLEFNGGRDSLYQHIADHLKYPESGNDSCLIGTIEIQVLVMPNEDVRILQMTDFNELGFDFWFEATNATTSTIGKWTPATFEGKKVATTNSIEMLFLPTADACTTAIDSYKQAVEKNNEGLALIEEEKIAEGIAKLSQAIELFPNDARFLMARGQALMNENRLEEACADLSKARDIALIDWFDNILQLICK